MSNQRPAMLVPALIGGALAGILTGIPIIDCLCCLWIVGGGAIAAYFLSKDSPIALKAGDGAIVGVFAGMVAAGVEFIISIPLAPLEEAFTQRIMEWSMTYTEEMPEFFRSMMESGGMESSLPWMLVGLVINVIIFSLLGALGGIIGISLFQKKTAPPAQGVIDVPKDQVQTETPDHNQS